MCIYIQYIYRKLRLYTFHVRKCGLCYGPDVVVKRLLCSLARSFKHLNPVSPIELREFGEKIALSYLVFGLAYLAMKTLRVFYHHRKNGPNYLKSQKSPMVGRVKSPFDNILI